MRSERPVNPRFDDDVHFNLVSGPPRYRNHTDKPVRYFTVVDKQGGAVLGYVWASDEDDAAMWEPCEAAGGRALAEGGHWYARLWEAKGRGILPSQALAEMLSHPEGNRGRALPGSLAHAPDAAAVEALAQGRPRRLPGEQVAADPPPTDGPVAHPAPSTPAGALPATEGAPPSPLPMCRFCGGSPAVEVAFRAYRGLVVFMGFRRIDGPMCLTCGLAVHRALTTHTLCVGWWSPFSLFVFAPLTLVRNLLAVRKVNRLPAPGPGTLGPRYDPGVPIHRRPRAYVALVPVLWVLFMIVTGLSGGA